MDEWLSVVRKGAEGHAQLALRSSADEVRDGDTLGPLIQKLRESRARALDGLTLRDLISSSGQESSGSTDNITSIG